jgi:hypothetical protein
VTRRSLSARRARCDDRPRFEPIRDLLGGIDQLLVAHRFERPDSGRAGELGVDDGSTRAGQARGLADEQRGAPLADPPSR